MKVNSEKNSYQKCIKSDNFLKVGENIGDYGEFDNYPIYNYAIENPQFKYFSVTHQQFNEKYSAEGWLGRKFVAVPATVWSGVIKTIYHLAIGIFIGIPIAFFDKGRYFKAQFFSVARDFQEAYGRLTSLFNDRYGQFHIQESGFHKMCYNCFAIRTRPYVYIVKISKHGVMVDSRAKKISLLDYKNKTAEEREKLAQRFELSQTKLLSLASNISLEKFVEQADTEILSDLTLEDLIIPFEKSKLKFALLEQEEFNALVIQDIETDINEDQFYFIRQRLRKLSKGEKSNQLQKKLDDYKDIKDIPLKDLVQIAASEISTKKEHIPAIAFAFFTNEQLQGLELSKLQASQNKNIFFVPGNVEVDKVEVDEAEIEGRLALFGDQDVIKAIYKGVLPGIALKFLSDAHVKGLELNKLNKQQVDLIFHRISHWDSDEESHRKRFANFTAEDVQSAMEAGILSSDHLELFSDDQLKGFDFSTASQKVINMVFPPYSVDYLRKKHSYFTRIFRAENGKVLEDREGMQCIIPEEKLQEMSKNQKKKNEDLLKKLSEKQRRDLEPRLYQKDESAKNLETGNSPQQQFNFESSSFLWETLFKELLGNDNDFDDGFFQPEAENGSGPQLSKEESYEVLGLEQSATQQEIRAKSRELILKYHPDKQDQKGSDENEIDYQDRLKKSREKFENVFAAYSNLRQQ